MGISVAIVTLGCAKNVVDTELMLGLIKNAGYQIEEDYSKAEVIVINTCGFIKPAKEESIDTILQAAGYKKTGKCRKLIVTGCLGQKYPDELAAEVPEIDAVLGTGDAHAIVEHLHNCLQGKRIKAAGEPDYDLIFGRKKNHERILTTPKHTAYLKIAEGCDNRCSYCVIPDLRGSYYSREIERVLSEAESLVASGVKEIVLIAQDTTRYGLDRYKEKKLADLVAELTKIPQLQWLRLLYSYPDLVDDKILQSIKDHSKICHYLDIPLQHASNRILHRMNRRTTKERAINLISKIRKILPDVALRTSFIVGFPGETDRDFQELLDFMELIRFDWVGLFIYSQEEGTPAAQMEDQQPEELKRERYNSALDLQQRITNEIHFKLINKVFDILVEGPSDTFPNMMMGRSYRNAPEIDGVIHFTGSAVTGSFALVKILDSLGYDLTGIELTPQ
ncbi:MAG: 30S ribosomal protein S12 methylthiotransferase RimO [Bacillota bacterium]